MKNDKTQYDDDFEKMLQDFIDDALDYDDEDDLETMDTHDEHEEPDEAEASGLPFPRCGGDARLREGSVLRGPRSRYFEGEVRC